MLICASRRTDIPALYAEWFVNRLKTGYALVPNPRNPQRLSRVELSPTNVDCIIFWTKNPTPMFKKLEQITQLGYPFITHFTLTPYGSTVERALPSKKHLVESFIELAKRTSPERVVWRYDPVIVNDSFSVAWHVERFTRMCDLLAAHAHRCVLSFIDPYKSIAKSFRAMTREEMTDIAAAFSPIARRHGIGLWTCAEEIDLSAYGIGHGACVDKGHIEQVIGARLELPKDINQRAACLCAAAVDLGAYDTCVHGCAYCYAVSSHQGAARRLAGHDPAAPMVNGYPRGDEIITDRTKASHKVQQLFLL